MNNADAHNKSQAAHRLDYEQTINLWVHLVDVRFRLLAIVPALSAAGIGLLGQVNELASLRVFLVAFLGLASVVALCVYDLRNSMFHDFAVHRAKAIERRLHLERTTRTLDDGRPRPLHPGELMGGIFAERPRFSLRLLGARVWHDRALALAYCASAGAWAALAAYSLAARLGPSRWSATTHQRLAALGGIGFAATLWFGIWWHDCRAAYFKHTLTDGDDWTKPWTPPTARAPKRWPLKPWTWSTMLASRLVKHWVDDTDAKTAQGTTATPADESS